MKRDIRLERVYPHPPELVWRALTDRELIGQWLMPNDFVAEEGHAFTMRTDPQPGFDGVVHARVLELDPPRRMRWAWQGGPLDTVVTFQLEPTIVYAQRATRLVLEHSGFEGLPAVLVSFIMKAGWGNMVDVLVPHLLDAMEEGRQVEDLRAECVAQRTTWKRLARLFGPVLRRTQT